MGFNTMAMGCGVVGHHPTEVGFNQVPCVETSQTTPRAEEIRRYTSVGGPSLPALDVWMYSGTIRKMHGVGVAVGFGGRVR